MADGILYFLRNIGGAFFVYKEKPDELSNPDFLSLGEADASGDLEKRLGTLVSENEGSYLVCIPASQMKGYERFERRQRFWESVRQTLDIRKYFVR